MSGVRMLHFLKDGNSLKSMIYYGFNFQYYYSHFVMCPAEGHERARVVPRAHKDSLSLYPAERQERNTLVM